MAAAHTFIDIGCDRSGCTKKIKGLTRKNVVWSKSRVEGIKNDSMDMYVTDDLDGETNGVLGCFTIDVTICGTPSTIKVVDKQIFVYLDRND